MVISDLPRMTITALYKTSLPLHIVSFGWDTAFHNQLTAIDDRWAPVSISRGHEHSAKYT
jgi:hypothetical protein